ncbi:MAG: MFS transporter [Chloroflexota bacterium]
MKLPKWSVAPYDVTGQQRKNFLYVQIDAVAIGLASAASPFLPVFLTRLGASNVQVGLLSSMPGVTGLVLSVIIGRFLQGRRNIVPWFSLSRLLVVSSYASTGLAPFIVPRQYLVPAVLGIWALATIPQTALSVCFSVVMNAVAGPNLRYDLMSRRWSILGLTTAIAVTAAGQGLELIGFPVNYQVVFLSFSLGGLLSFYFSSRIVLPERLPTAPAAAAPGAGAAATGAPGNGAPVLGGRGFGRVLALLQNYPNFARFSTQRFIYQFGMLLATPLFPIYYVREVHASDAWIGFISTSQTAILMVGYFLWPRQSRKRGPRFVLLAATFGLALYPALAASTHQVLLIALFAGIAGIFQAGIDLVFFDELMKTVPDELSATFVSIAQSLNYLAAMLAPLFGTWLAGSIGLAWALVIATAIRLAGFALFALWKPRPDC